jgi:hypothetical protein
MQNKIYLYLNEKVTLRYRNGQFEFALKMLGENEIDLYVYTDRMISIEGLLDKCNAGDTIFVVETRWLQSEFIKTKMVDGKVVEPKWVQIIKFGDACYKKHVFIQILNPLHELEHRFNFKYGQTRLILRHGVANGKRIDNGLYANKQKNTW